MESKKPLIRQTVGAQYYAFNNPTEPKTFDASKYDATIKTETVKKVATTEGAESQVIYASGKAYKTQNKVATTDIVVDNIAFPPEDIAKMRGETVTENGLIITNSNGERPYFAYGKTVKYDGGSRLEWFPKCQLVENTDELETTEDKPKEQVETLTIRAYPFNDKEDLKMSIDSQIKPFADGVTEDTFFAKPITTAEDFDKLVAPVL